MQDTGNFQKSAVKCAVIRARRGRARGREGGRQGIKWIHEIIRG